MCVEDDYNHNQHHRHHGTSITMLPSHRHFHLHSHDWLIIIDKAKITLFSSLNSRNFEKWYLFAESDDFLLQTNIGIINSTSYRYKEQSYGHHLSLIILVIYITSNHHQHLIASLAFGLWGIWKTTNPLKRRVKVSYGPNNPHICYAGLIT